ncbi:hypothetical protein ACWCQ0_53260 [Streptomyces massasporeus]
MLRRTGAGELLLRPRGGAQVPVRPGEPAGLGDHELVVRGGRPAPAGGRSTPRFRPPRRTGGGAGGGGTGDTGAGSGRLTGTDADGSPGASADSDHLF